MTPGQIEKSIKRLKKRVCCLLNEETITEGSLSGVRVTYKKLLNNVVSGMPTRISMLEELKEISKLINKLYCIVCFSIPEQQLVNEEGDTDLVYPLGVLDINGNYIDIANDETEYITLWNSAPINQAVGTILSGTGTTFQISYVDPEGPPFNLYGLEFYTVTGGAANSVMHVNDNDIIVYGATAVRGSTGTNTLSSSIDIYNGTFGVNITPAVTIRRVTTVAAVDAPIRVFHSRVSTRVGMNTLSDCKTLTGVLPKECLTLALRVRNSTDLVSGVANWSELDKIEWWTVIGLGGGVFNITNPSFVPTPPPSVIGLALRDVDGSALTLSNFLWFNDASLPNLRKIFISANSIDLITPNISWVLTIPKVDQQFTLTNNGGPLTNAANSDSFINNLATALSGIVAVSPATIRLQNTTARTAASQTSVNNLTAAGWTVTFS